MKKTVILWMIAGGFAMQAAAAGNDNSPSASNKNVHRETLQQQVNQMLKPAAVNSDKIERVGNISSRPWAQTAGSMPRTYFVDESYNEPRFNLLWLVSKPK